MASPCQHLEASCVVLAQDHPDRDHAGCAFIVIEPGGHVPGVGVVRSYGAPCPCAVYAACEACGARLCRQHTPRELR